MSTSLRALACLCSLFLLSACESLHSQNEHAVPVAVWASSSLFNTHPSSQPPAVRERIARVLKDAGLRATVDDTGVTVDQADENRAREVLLTDPRLTNTDIIVVLFVHAGSARKTAAGFEITTSTRPASTQSPSTAPIPNAAQWLSRPDVQFQFRARSTRAAVAEFRQLLSVSTDLAAQTRALQMVLFTLSDAELGKLGITQVHQPDGLEWSIAWSPDGPAINDAMNDVLYRQSHIAPLGSSDLGQSGWYVPRTQFFQARNALLASPKIQNLPIQVVTPTLPNP